MRTHIWPDTGVTGHVTFQKTCCDVTFFTESAPKIFHVVMKIHVLLQSVQCYEGPGRIMLEITVL